MNPTCIEATLTFALSLQRDVLAARGLRPGDETDAEGVAGAQLVQRHLLQARLGEVATVEDSLASAQVAELEQLRALFERALGVDAHALMRGQQLVVLQQALALEAKLAARVNAALLAIAGATRHVQQIRVGVQELEAGHLIDPVVAEIALAARWSEHETRSRLHTARVLEALLPATSTAMTEGRISAGHATVIAEAAGRLAVGLGVDVTHPDREADAGWQQLQEMSTALDTCGVARAVTTHRTGTRQTVHRLVDRLDPIGMRKRREKAAAQRCVFVVPERDGNSLLIARMSTLHANACLTAITHHANTLRETNPQIADMTGGEARTQALTDLLLKAGHHTGMHRETNAADTHTATTRIGQALSASIDVVITLDALLGLRAAAGDDLALIRGPGGLDDWIPAAEIRDLITDGADITLRRLVTEPLTGHLLDASPTRYAPSERLRAFITARDQRCRWPGCTARAQHCDLDHATPYDQGGPTVRANLGALCRGHHRIKTHAGHHITHSLDDGSCTITTSTGLTFTHQAPAVLPDEGASTHPPQHDTEACEARPGHPTTEPRTFTGIGDIDDPPPF